MSFPELTLWTRIGLFLRLLSSGSSDVRRPFKFQYDKFPSSVLWCRYLNREPVWSFVAYSIYRDCFPGGVSTNISNVNLWRNTIRYFCFPFPFLFGSSVIVYMFGCRHTDTHFHTRGIQKDSVDSIPDHHVTSVVVPLYFSLYFSSPFDFCLSYL